VVVVVPDEGVAHCDPTRVQARFANVASGEAGATMVKMSPAMKVVAQAIVKVAVIAPAAKTMVPTFEPFFRVL
jgi:hypothetical protein